MCSKPTFCSEVLGKVKLLLVVKSAKRLLQIPKVVHKLPSTIETGLHETRAKWINAAYDREKNKLRMIDRYLVQFWTPSPVTQRRGERVQDHLSAHARRLVSFLANGYCACVHLAWQYGGSFEGIG